MEPTFKPNDEVLQQLLAERREEVVRLQKAKADEIKDLETRGQAQLVSLKKTLPKEFVTVLNSLAKAEDGADAATKSRVDKIKAKLAASGPPPEGETAMHPGLAGGHLVAPSSLGWFMPYYSVVHGPNGNITSQGYGYYPGNIQLGVETSGTGSGISGTGANGALAYVDWWFSYLPPEDGSYTHTIWVPFHGFYILYSDDGFWTSKEVIAEIVLEAIGYQYAYKNQSLMTVLDIDSQNIYINARFDGWRTMNYTDLLSPGRAWLRATAVISVYARGGGSTAQVNFINGNFNYIAMPWLYVA